MIVDFYLSNMGMSFFKSLACNSVVLRKRAMILRSASLQELVQTANLHSYYVQQVCFAYRSNVT